MTESPKSKDEILRAIVDIENDSSRFRLLDRLCGDDSRLRRDVLDQLSRELDEDLTSQSPWLNGDTEIHPSEQDDVMGYAAGTVIGPYEIVRPIGRGGMGSVYLAKQKKPVVRDVALKVVRSGLDSREVIARFENERQTLALMEHPNIARILDAGTTEDARPYFVMEYVQGMRITDFCNRNRLDINQRLKLFADVCSGVQHAHQKGIIHRDLKPSNILVMEVDGRPVPKVIDFGLAKALENPVQLTQMSLYQGFRQIVGTLRYMSPEQASLTSVDVDTRTDIYSLGVILYELLTGSTPLESKSISNRAVLALLASLQYRDPVRPSNRLTQSGETLVSTIAEQRQTDTSRLKRLLARDLDWIVMKALEKDRGRRYESVSGFTADVQRYLSNEPVVARPPSAK